MPKRKSKNPETVEELLTDLESANETIIEKLNDAVNDEKPQEEQQLNDSKRDQLLKLAEDVELDKSVVYIKKASKKIIDKLFSEHERKRSQKANEFLTDLLLSKFADGLGGLDAIEKPEALSDELKKDELLKRDVLSLVESISPYIPFLGVLSGIVTAGKHVYTHQMKKQDTVNKETDSKEEKQTNPSNV